MCKASCRIFAQLCGEVIRLLFHCNNIGFFGMIRATNWTFMNNLLAVFVADSSGSGALAIKSSSSSSTLLNVPSKSSETLRSKWSSSFPRRNMLFLYHQLLEKLDVSVTLFPCQDQCCCLCAFPANVRHTLLHFVRFHYNAPV